MDGAMGMNGIGWAECVNCSEKRVEAEAVEMMGENVSSRTTQ